jgi:glycine cleavage system H protein
VADNLRFSSDHLWIKLEDDNTAVIGLTDEPLKLIQNFNRIRFPEEGTEIIVDETFGAIMENKKILFPLVAPLSGEILSINDDIEDATEVLLEDCYGEGWLIRLLIQAPEEVVQLLTREEYEESFSDSIEEESDYDEEEDEEDDFYEEDDDDDDDYDDY